MNRTKHSIIARLRNPYWIYGRRPSKELLREDRDEAADEIERLRVALLELRAMLQQSGYTPPIGMRHIIDSALDTEHIGVNPD